MADRTMVQGDTYPPLKGQASDESGVLNLSSAQSLVVKAIGATHTITGNAAAIWPAQADADGIHFWNWQYIWAAGDTAVLDEDYRVELVVTWAAGPPALIQTFRGPSLAIEAP